MLLEHRVDWAETLIDKLGGNFAEEMTAGESISVGEEVALNVELNDSVRNMVAQGQGTKRRCLTVFFMYSIIS